MAEIITGKGLDRTHIKSKLMAESLVDKRVLKTTATDKEINILPDLNVIGIGGHSILDRGKSAVFPLIDEIIKNKGQYKMILGVSGGARTRHIFSVALDLGIPTGGLAHVAGASEEQYEKMLQALLAKHGGIQLTKDHIWDIPHKLASGMIPIMIGMPPYHYWEQPPRQGRLPMNGSDFGLFIFAEAMGARSMIYLKDEDGLYTDDPKKNPKAEFIPKISVQELLKRDLPDLLIERMVLETMMNARHVKAIYIVNGLKPGNLTRALNHENAGTIIYKAE
ncbi:MAG: uridine kinase [Nitrospirae bacterium]|nr:uridine kinase [Nitrospirota bacterium]